MIDATGIHALQDFHTKCIERGTALILSGVSKGLFKALHKSGLIAAIGKKNTLSHIDMALVRAKKILDQGLRGSL